MIINEIEHMFVGVYMVKSYLKNLREDFLKEKIDISNRLDNLSNQYKENSLHIKLLEETEDPNFESFTPREVNRFNKRKLAELNEEQILLQEEIDSYKDMLSKSNDKISEVSTIIKSIHESKEEFVSELELLSNRVSSVLNEENNLSNLEYREELKYLKSKLEELIR